MTLKSKKTGVPLNRKRKNMPSILGGALIVAGTAIGAGMLANPTGTSGVWFIGSLIVLILTWFCMSLSGLMLLEVNLHFPIGASFNTIVKNLLGRKLNLIIGLIFSFTLFCFIYAYISVGGEMFRIIFNSFSSRFLDNNIHLSRISGCLIFTLVLAFCVGISRRLMDRISFIFMFILIFSFILTVSGMLGNVRLTTLFNLMPNGKLIYWKYIWLAFPLCMAAFEYQVVVPSLVIYYKKDGKKVAKTIFWGMLITLIMYVLWQLVIHGNLPRHKFKPVIDANGDVVVLLRELSYYIQGREMHIGNFNISVRNLIDTFAFSAIVSSFLGSTLGLFDYVTDLFQFKATKSGKLKSAFFTYIPPLLACILFPAGFIKLLGCAGFLTAFWAVITPAILLLICRKKIKKSTYKVFGGNFIIYAVLSFGILNILAQIFIWFKIFPVFKG